MSQTMATKTKKTVKKSPRRDVDTSNVRHLLIATIRIDGGTQPRAEINQVVVDEYAEAISEGEKLPPVKVFSDGKHLWLADGFHRYHGHRKANQSMILADVEPGTLRDAILYSCGANATHGLRRTAEDKRQAAMTLLQDPEWAKWSDREIAKRCGIHHNTVGKLRGSLANLSSEDAPAPAPAERAYTTKHGTQATMNTENIGKPKAASASIDSYDDEPAESSAHPDQAITLQQAAANDDLQGLVETIDEVQRLVRSAATLAREGLGFVKHGEAWTSNHPLTHRITYSSSVAPLLEYVRELEGSKPVEVDAKGVVTTKRDIQKREALRK